MTAVEKDPAALLEHALRLGTGFRPEDRTRVLDVLRSLARHLAGWRQEQVTVEVRVKDRDRPEQKVTLEARLAGWPTFVATAAHPDLDHALVEARQDLIRHVEEEKTRRDPRRTRNGPPVRPR
ncbi:MAG: hypothetical protein ACRDWY_00220 [Actinomycetes bacterium]